MYYKTNTGVHYFACNYGKYFTVKLQILILMKISQAVGLRIKELLTQRKMTLSKLEKESGVLHGTMSGILYGRNKGVTLAVLIKISKGFGMRYQEFLDSPFLDEKNLDID